MINVLLSHIGCVSVYWVCMSTVIGSESIVECHIEKCEQQKNKAVLSPKLNLTKV